MARGIHLCLFVWNSFWTFAILWFDTIIYFQIWLGKNIQIWLNHLLKGSLML